MVTHNPELAKNYSTRIVKLLDGVITDDSDPYTLEEDMKLISGLKRLLRLRHQKRRLKKLGRSRKHLCHSLTALSLSFNNLMTKKTRTIYCICRKHRNYRYCNDSVYIKWYPVIHRQGSEEDTLSSYPITLQAEAIDISSMVTSMTGNSDSRRA